MTAQTEAPARFTATHRSLSDALKVVALGITARPVVPVLGGVLAETRDGVLTLRGFDCETSVSVRVDCDADGEALHLFDFAELKQVLAASVAGETATVAARTRVSVEDAVLSTPDLAVPLTVMPSEEYPAFPPAAPVLATVDGAEWFRQVDRVLPAACTDDTLPALTHVHLRIADGALHLSATDRYRLAVAEVDATDCAVDEVTTLIPAGVLERVSRLLRKHTGPVTVGVSDDGENVSLTFGPVTVTTRATGTVGEFPRIGSLLPSEAAPIAVRVGREALVRAVRKAAALSKAKGAWLKGLVVPRVHLEFGPAGVTVSPGLNDEAEQSRVRGLAVAGELLTGDQSWDGPLKANGTFLLDALGAFAGDTVTLHARTPAHPFLLTDGPSIAGEGYRHLVMPLRDPR